MKSCSSLIIPPFKRKLTPQANLAVELASSQAEPTCKQPDLTVEDIELISRHSREIKKFAINKFQNGAQDMNCLQIIDMITRNVDKITVTARKARAEVVAGGMYANAYSEALAWQYGRQLALAEMIQEYGT